jgi:isocitrate dehydrogenase kinase/phosphatase
MTSQAVPATAPLSELPVSEQRTRQLARAAATAIYGAFESYHASFRAVTQRARIRFAQRDWAGAQRDAVERLELYGVVVNEVVAGLRTLLGPAAAQRHVWHAIRDVYGALIAQRNDLELAETFYNSVTRRIFITVGVAPDIEFVWFGATYLPSGNETPVHRPYVKLSTSQAVMTAILADCDVGTAFENLARDAARAAAVLDAGLVEAWGSPDFDVIQMLTTVFYRNKGAYLIGRIRRRNRVLPIVVALLHGVQGVRVDTVLLTESDASLVFSFTRSYFHVEVDHPAELVGFLKSIMPLKPVAELYTAIGYNKHGKTALYRDLYRHLGNSNDRFEVAPGAKGMVMAVFTLPSYDVVFKVIRDRFADPKSISRQEVMERYRLVFKHDRVGRMVDAQEFEYLTFSRDRFSAALLDELLDAAAQSVEVADGQVIIRHLYTERRLYPLDLYLKEMDLDKARAAIVEYGNAICDLAAANVFPGDLFFKNFGVTRHGRVVLYDYDELCLVSDCTFRTMPQARTFEDEMAAEPWFPVGKNDIFPEELRTFLWLPKPLRATLEEAHGELFTVEFWEEMQARHRAGEILDVFPYDQEKRFRDSAFG